MNDELIFVAAKNLKYYDELISDQVCHVYEDDCSKCPLYGRHESCGSVDTKLLADRVLQYLEMKKIGAIK